MQSTRWICNSGWRLTEVPLQHIKKKSRSVLDVFLNRVERCASNKPTIAETRGPSLRCWNSRRCDGEGERVRDER